MSKYKLTHIKAKEAVNISAEPCIKDVSLNKFREQQIASEQGNMKSLLLRADGQKQACAHGINAV